MNNKLVLLSGIKDWVQGFWGCIMAKFESVLWQEVLSNCIVLLHVAPPLLFTVTSFTAMPTNNLAAPSSSLGVYLNVIWGICTSKLSLFLCLYVLFQLAQLFTRGSRYRFPKRWNWQYAMPTARAVKLSLCTFCSKLQTFPTVKSKTFGFLLHRTQKYCLAWVTSGKRAAKRPLCSLFKGSWHMLRYMVHITLLQMFWNLLEVLCRTTFSVTYSVRIAHAYLNKVHKDKTVRNSKNPKTVQWYCDSKHT